MTTKTTYKYLPPEFMDKVGRAGFLAQSVIEGHLQGLHKSPFHGFSVEFAEYRQYVKGDALKFLDWNVYAKTDRYYIKLFQQETNLRAYMALDMSRSMAYGSGETTKYDYAAYLVSALQYLLTRQQDAPSLWAYAEKLLKFAPPSASLVQMRETLCWLEETEPQGKSQVGKMLHDLAAQIRKRSVVLVLSDLLDDPAEVMRGLAHLRHQKHEVILFHILDPMELRFETRGLLEIRDLETGGKLQLEADLIRTAYQERVQKFTQEYRRFAASQRIDYQLVDTSVPYDTFLMRYLNTRSKPF